MEAINGEHGFASDARSVCRSPKTPLGPRRIGRIGLMAALVTAALCAMGSIPASAIAGSVVTEAATGVKLTQATLHAKVNPEGWETVYYFEYGKSESYLFKIPFFPESVGSGTSPVEVSQTPTGLSEGKTYHFRVVAESKGVISNGEDKTFNTIGPPKINAKATTATAIKAAQATLNSKVSPAGLATSYWFEYGKTESYGAKIPASPESIGSGTSEVAVSQTPTGLSEDTEYHFRVVAENEEGISEGVDKTFKTGPWFSLTFGEEGSGDGKFQHPAEIAIDAEGNIWVADMKNNRVQEFNKEGKYLFKFGEKGSGEGQLLDPKSIAIDAKGNIWVADAGNHRVQEFNKEGKYLFKFGEKGSGEGQFGEASELSGPESIAIDAKGNIWVADTYNGRLQKFNEEGKFLEVVGSHGSEPGQLGEPSGIDIGPGGNVWVADWQNECVIEFNEAGEFIQQFGEEGAGNGQFNHPDTIDVDESGNVRVIDEENSRIERFDEKGAYLGSFGTEGTGEGQFRFYFPTGIATDTEGNLWVADTINNRVQKFTLNPPKVTTEAATVIKGTQATLNGKVNPQGLATTYWFEYGKTEAYGTKIPVSPESVGSSSSNVAVSQTPTGLSEGTEYHFRVVAENKAGTSKGEDKTFTTFKLPKVTTEAASSVKATQATLNAKVNPEGLATTYWFEYGKTESYGTKIPVSPGSVGSGSSYVAVSQTPTGLSKGTTYHFRVVAENEAGTSKGEDQKFITPGLPKVTTEAATAIKLTQANLNAIVNPNRAATTYWFEYGKTTSYGTQIPISPESVGSGSSNVAVSQTPTGLSEGTEYHFRVGAENEAGTSNGTDKTFTTLSN